jgi:iron complex transport system substrate-binding protein
VAGVRREGAATVVTFRGGREVHVPRDPRRVVSTLPGLTETWVFLGGADRLVAVSPHCDLPPGSPDLPRLAVLPLDREALAALRPDLVLVDEVLYPEGLDEAVGEEDGRGPAVLPLASASLAHLRATVALLAAVLGTPEAARARLSFEADLDAALRECAPPPGDPRPPRVLLLAQADPLYALGPGSLLADLLRACGAVNLACDLGRASGPFAEEVVLARRPDVVVDVEGHALPAPLLERWSGVPAVRDGRVALLDEDLFVRGGPRTPEALRRIARLVRPAAGPAGGVR